MFRGGGEVFGRPNRKRVEELRCPSLIKHRSWYDRGAGEDARRKKKLTKFLTRRGTKALKLKKRTSCYVILSRSVSRIVSVGVCTTDER